MPNIQYVPLNPNRLWAGSVAYALYKVYPSGKTWLVGHFCSPYDYEAEIDWLESHEPEAAPISYRVEEVGYSVKGEICDSRKYADAIMDRARKLYYARQEAIKSYARWKADLERRGIDEHSLPLSQRRMPPMWGASLTWADTIRYCYMDSTTARPKWAAEGKRVEELISTALATEGKPERNMHGIDIALRYLYKNVPANGHTLTPRNRAERRKFARG